MEYLLQIRQSELIPELSDNLVLILEIKLTKLGNDKTY